MFSLILVLSRDFEFVCKFGIFLLKLKLDITCVRGKQRCSIQAAVGKDEANTLPRVSATHTNIIGTPIRNLPPSRHFQRLFSIINLRATIDSAHMQRHVEVAAVALGNTRYSV